MYIYKGDTMPAPNPRRGAFLKYLRESFPHKYDYVSPEETVYPYAQIKICIENLKDNDPQLLRVLWYHMHTRLPRTRAAEQLFMDPTTVKRKLDFACDLIMQFVEHQGLWPKGLFSVRKDDGSLEIRDTAITFTGPLED
jgi:hypothetical protein